MQRKQLKTERQKVRIVILNIIYIFASISKTTNYHHHHHPPIFFAREHQLIVVPEANQR